MEEVEVPQYFLCPISLEIMKDPVTTVTGITYDRKSIERWLLTAEDETGLVACPVTKQPLTRDTELLTPNHMLWRVIQSWCIANADKGVDQIPTPTCPVNKTYVFRLIRQVNNPELYVEALRKMDTLVRENEKNRKCMDEAGAIKAMVSFIVKSFKEGKIIIGLEEAFRIFHLVWSQTHENKNLVMENHDLIEAILWVLKSEMNNNTQVIIKTHAVMVLKDVTEISSSNLISGLNHEFFKVMVNMLRKNISEQGTKATLRVLINTCTCRRNRMKMIDSRAILELIELELSNKEKRVSELVFTLLADLCSLADGRAQFLEHEAGIALVSIRTLSSVSSSATRDDRALQILGLICKFCGTKEVIMEMLRVGAVSKLCMVIQADCEACLKKKAMEILRVHSHVWSNSPCIYTNLSLHKISWAVDL